jgi:hypothetical protein
VVLVVLVTVTVNTTHRLQNADDERKNDAEKPVRRQRP